MSCEDQRVMKTVLLATVFVARRTRSAPQKESAVAVERTPETVEMEALAVMADNGSIGSSAPSAPPVSQHVSPSASQLLWLQSPFSVVLVPASGHNVPPLEYLPDFTNEEKASASML